MDRETIIGMARNAGFERHDAMLNHPNELMKFASLVAAIEREACARLCETMDLEWKDQPAIAQAELATLKDCALAIRSRSN